MTKGLRTKIKVPGKGIAKTQSSETEIKVEKIVCAECLVAVARRGRAQDHVKSMTRCRLERQYR